MRAQAKAQANAPTMLDAQQKMQKVISEVAKLPIETEEKERDFKAPPSRITQQTPKGIVLPPEFVLSPIVVPQMIGCHLSLQTLMKLIQICIKDQIQEWI